MELIMTNTHPVPPSGTNLHAQPNLSSRVRRESSADAMSKLLRRYPNINDAELLELVEFLKKGHPDVIAMVTYGAGLEPRVIAVKKDHPEQFRSGFRVWLPWLGILMVPLLLSLLSRML